MSKQKKRFIFMSIFIAILFTVGVVFATTTANYHYVLDVVKDTAVNKDDKLQITETIKKDSKGDYGAKELNYEVELKNVSQEENENTEVAILIDDSYSMEGNNTFTTAKNTAVELTSDILSNIYNSSVSISKNSGIVYNRSSSYSMSNYNAIRNLAATSVEDVNNGLDLANSTLSKESTVKTNLYRMLKKIRKKFSGGEKDEE